MHAPLQNLFVEVIFQAEEILYRGENVPVSAALSALALGFDLILI